jgi:predicted CXXCH cytochrome family protein
MGMIRRSSIKTANAILCESKKSTLTLLCLAFVYCWFAPAIAAAQTAEFVGSDQCVQCHQAKYTQWQQSDHHKAMQAANATTVLGDFDNATVSFHGIETRLFRENDVFKVATTGKDGKPGVFTIAYTFGHYPLQQYLIDTGKGHLQALNVAWDSRSQDSGGQRWFHLQASEDIDPEHPFFWARHFQNANSRCIACHSTNVAKNYDPETRRYATAWAETGVGCESCHGPASQHLALATTHKLSSKNSGFNRRPMTALTWTFNGEDDIATPNGIRNDAHIDTCGGCHSRRSISGDHKPFTAYHDQYRLALLERGLYFADGQVDDEVFVLGSFLQSKMHLKGVTCANCHDAHSAKLIAQGNALCAQCHKPARFDSTAHHRHQAGSDGAQCVNCHMPERTYMMVDPRRDHSFGIPDPDLSSRTDAPDACTTCHQGRSDKWAANALAGWGISGQQNAWALINQGLDHLDALMFKDFARHSASFALPPMREASLLSKLAGFPSKLSVDSASRQLASANPLIRRAAVSALRPMPAQLRWQLLSPLIDDPVKTVRLEVAGALAEARPQLADKDATRLDALIDEYREALKYNADTPAGQLAIGNLEANLGFIIRAEKAYLRSLEIESSYVPTLINLADFYRASGENNKSRELMLRALRVAPDSANTNLAYALFLIRSGQQDEALGYLKTAIEQEDAAPRHVHIYAVALDSRGETGKAIKTIDAASRQWPNNIELSFLQVSYMDKTGKTDGIHRYLALLASVAAQNAQVKTWMKKYGTKRNS